MKHPAAHPGHCPHCRHPVLNGLDGDICARPAAADPTPLDAQGEAVAQLLGLATYRHDTDGRLWYRDQWQIAGQPAGTHDPHTPGDVLAQHQCGIDLSQFQTISDRNIPTPQTNTPGQNMPENNAPPY